jgi:hypothetical protein
MSRIDEFKLGKGITASAAGKDGPWTKKYFELTVQIPEQFSEQDFQAALTRAEYLIDSFLGQPPTAAAAAPQAPEFDPQLLMGHKGWKAKKKDDGSYAEGSLSWGWDFPDKFSKEAIEVLERGPIEIDKYVFSLDKERSLVSAKKKKGE